MEIINRRKYERKSLLKIYKSHSHEGENFFTITTIYNYKVSNLKNQI